MPAGLSLSDFYYILPEIVLTVGLLVLLIVESLTPRERHVWLAWLSIGVLGATAVSLLPFAGLSVPVARGLMAVDGFGAFFKVLFVVSAGINDIHAGRSAEDVASAFTDFVATVRRALPRTTIVFLAIAPSFARWHERDEQARANALVREIVATGDRLAYVDAARAYLRPDGLPAAECFVADGLHPTPVGYARRAAVLRPLLAPFLAP